MNRIFAVCALAALALAVGACGSQDDGGGGGDATGSGDEPIVIGATVSLTGPNAQVGPQMQDAIELFEEEVNANGGILGRDVEILVSDDKSDPETAAQLYTKFINQDDVDLIVGTYGAPIIQRVSAIAEQNQMLFVQAVGTPESLFENGFKYMFLGSPMTAEGYAEPYFDWLGTLPDPPETAAFLTQDSIATRGLTDSALGMAKELGMEIVMDDYYAPEASNMTPLATKVADTEADLVYQNGYVPDSLAFAKAFCATAAAPAVLTTGIPAVTLDTYPEQVGEDCAEGTTQTAPYHPSLPTPENEAFMKAWTAKFGEDSAPLGFQASMYSTLEIVQQAVEGVGGLDQAQLRDFVQDETMLTVVGELSYADNGTPEKSGGLVIQWQGGKTVIIYPDSVATAEAIYPRD